MGICVKIESDLRILFWGNGVFLNGVGVT